MINKERLIQDFIELVSLPCPSKDEKQEAELISQKMKALGVQTKVDDANKETGGTVGNLWGFLPGNVAGAPSVLFEAHMDSVAPTTGTKVVRKDGVLYSDGTTTLGGDDKVGIAAVLEALRVIKENNLPHGDIQVLCAISEEVGSLGVRYLDKSWIKSDYGFCLDCGGHAGQIFNFSPKAYKLTYTVTGKAAHAGEEPEKGINAIMLSAAALSRLKYGRLDEMTTLSVGLINGGLASNIVAEQCQFAVDMRCPDPVKLDRLKEDTTRTIRETVTAGGAKLQVEEFTTGPEVFVKEEEPVCQLAAAAAKKLGYPVEYKFTGGLSDANFLCGYGLPTVNLATGMSKIHSKEEELAEQDLYEVSCWVLGIIKEAAAQK